LKQSLSSRGRAFCLLRQEEGRERRISDYLLLEVHPQFGVHKAVKTIKGKTSRILRQEFPWLTTKLPSLWTNSYFCSTVGGAPLNIVKQYIENQKTSQRK
jgi:putative transposase